MDALTVGYVVNNPKAQYVATPTGVLATAGRNTANFPPINALDVTAAKRFNFTERVSLEFSARMFNILNHPQYVNASVSDVAPILTAASASTHGFYIPTNQNFGNPSEFFSSNPRIMVLALKLIF